MQLDSNQFLFISLCTSWKGTVSSFTTIFLYPRDSLQSIVIAPFAWLAIISFSSTQYKVTARALTESHCAATFIFQSMSHLSFVSLLIIYISTCIDYQYADNVYVLFITRGSSNYISIRFSLRFEFQVNYALKP